VPRYQITSFKSQKVALKELEPFFRNVAVGKKRRPVLESGRPVKRFGNMLPRELVVNWLFTAVGNYIAHAERFDFTSDPREGDGLIYDEASETAIWTEHVMVRGPIADAMTGILTEVKKKIAKGGTAYAGGKHLLVFMYGGDGARWWPNKVAATLPSPSHFDHVWVVGFQSFEPNDPSGDRIYGITRLDLRRGHCPAWWVRIASNFESWEVTERPPAASGTAS
jgi:hypothetical protein